MSWFIMTFRSHSAQGPQTAELDEKGTIIVAVVSTLAFLFLLILLIVCYCTLAR